MFQCQLLQCISSVTIFCNNLSPRNQAGLVYLWLRQDIQKKAVWQILRHLWSTVNIIILSCISHCDIVYNVESLVDLLWSKIIIPALTSAGQLTRKETEQYIASHEPVMPTVVLDTKGPTVKIAKVRVCIYLLFSASCKHHNLAMIIMYFICAQNVHNNNVTSQSHNARACLLIIIIHPELSRCAVLSTALLH